MKSVILIVFTTVVISIHVSVAVTRINATLGSNVTLECQNLQNETITWRGPYKGNTIYAEANNTNTNLPEDLRSRVFITIDDDTKKSYLWIVDVHIRDQGTYTCSNDTTGTNQIEEFNLVLPVTTINATLGSTVTLECPNLQNETITWRGPYKGNTMYAETNNINTNLPEVLRSRVFITIDDDTKRSYLWIVDVHIRDQGTYTCSDDTTGTNQIEEFNLVLPVTRINATLGSTVTLECEDSQNQKITWRGPYKGNAIYAETNNINTNLPEDLHSRVFITIDDDTNKSYLRIVDVRISDQGTYTCSNDTNQIGAFNLVLPALLNSTYPLYYRYLLVDSISKKLIVGFMNNISFIDIPDTTDYTVNSKFFHFRPQDENYCSIILSDKPKVPYCQNHIRFITRKNDQILILFGTNANSPTRYEFNMTDSTNIIVDGSIPSSKDPFDNFTAIYVSSNNPDNQALMYYAATTTDPKISRPIYKDGPIEGYMTSIVSTKWLKAPQFVGSFDVVDRVLFFFRETAIEVEPEHKIYSRVAKVCKRDIGGDRKLRNTWTGYQKARLDCSIPGEFPIYFDVIQDVVTKDNIFYGLFTSGTGIPASAICAFKLSEIDRVFNGPFKTRASSTSIWIKATSVPTLRPGQCTNDSMSTTDDVLTFIGEHPLMHESVQPLYDKPIFVLNNEELQIFTLHDDMSDLVFYAASNTGKVYKLFSKGKETYVSSTYSPTQNSEPIWSMQQYNDSLYIGTDYLVRQIKIINCEQYRWIDSCVKDPHCAWINNGTSIDMEIQCYNRCRSLTFVRENGLVNVSTHDNYNQSQTEYHCPPAKPKYIQIITVHATTIEIRWVAGFDGGVDQTFVLEYRLSKTTSWNTSYPNWTGLEEDPQYFELSGLSSGSVYDIQMYARNTVGNSAKTNIISVSTTIISVPTTTISVPITTTTTTPTPCTTIISMPTTGAGATVQDKWTSREKILIILLGITSLLALNYL